MLAVLLIASNITDRQLDEGRRAWGQRYAEEQGGLAVMVDVTGLPVRENPLPYHVIVSGDLTGGQTPVLLMHGSPGAAYGFEGLAEALSQDGRPVIWLDLPGFASQSEPPSRGRVFDSYSSQNYAAIMWRVLDALGVERTHLVGWSNSGAVGLHMADTEPQRTASLTLLAAVGAQDTEGSGQYAFEHLKYKIGKALLVWGAPVYPHFGLIGPRSERRAFLSFFDDTDQRLLAGIMERLDVPTLVLHGRDDFLVPAWGAERHHALIPASRLVMLDGSHFFPMTDPGLAERYLGPFLLRHDTAGVAPDTSVLDLSPALPVGRTGAAVHRIGWWIRDLHWTLGVLVFVLLCRFMPVLGVVIAGLLAGTGLVDFGIAGMGVMAGRLWWNFRRSSEISSGGPALWLGSPLWAFLSFLIVWLALAPSVLLWTSRAGAFGLGVGLLVAYAVLQLARHGWTRAGRAALHDRFLARGPLGRLPARTRALTVYAAAVAASALLSNLPGQGAAGDPDKRSVAVAVRDAPGDADPLETLGISVEIDEPTDEASPGPAPAPVLLLHGSPGSADNFDRLAPLLGEGGRLVVRPDLAGFGGSARGPDLSYPVQAEYMLEMLTTLGIERAHVVGWSNGGGVGIWMAHNAPERVASLTLLASVGAQETEGSGSYAFEQLKYKIGTAVLGYGVELVPHFGLLGSFRSRTNWLKNFDDSDQRELTAIMPTLRTPTLVLHGREDFLVRAWAAEEHHRLIPTSSLVMLDAGHFLPVLQPEETAEHVGALLARHDRAGVPALTATTDLSPVPERGPTARTLHSVAWGVRHVPWFVAVPVFALVARFRPLTGIILAGVLVATGFVDFGVAGLGVVIGRGWWAARSGVLDRPRTPGGWLAMVGWTLVAFLLAWLGVGTVTVAWTDSVGGLGLLGGVVLGVALLVLARFVWHRTGRCRLRAGLTRLLRQEYWPAWTHYLPTYLRIPRWFLLAGCRPVFTAVNPGYAHDGGMAAEKKHEIIERLRDPAVLHARLLPAEPDAGARAAQGAAMIKGDAALGGYPVVCKPDQGERGRSVRLVYSDAELRGYLEEHAEPVLVQRYHPGPVEVGVLWVRDPATIERPDRPGLHGRIYAVTHKTLPTLVGDGRRTLRQLILSHPRHRAQAAVFLERMHERLADVPAAGEEVGLGAAGNHSQGALFVDGSRFVTPALEAKIDRMARSFAGGFDIGRFDIRCATEAELMAGENLGVIELNGVTSEPTNIYDPSWSIFRAQSVLLGYWRRLVELGMARQRTGTGASISWREVFSILLGWKIRSRRRKVSG